MPPSDPDHSARGSTLAQRIFLAHLELSYRLGRKVTLAELGELVARQMERQTPFKAGAVSRWENGSQMPSPEVIEAIAAVTHTDPGWISHGDKSAAPSPRAQRLGATPSSMPMEDIIRTGEPLARDAERLDVREHRA